MKPKNKKVTFVCFKKKESRRKIGLGCVGFVMFLNISTFSVFIFLSDDCVFTFSLKIFAKGWKKFYL